MELTVIARAKARPGSEKELEAAVMEAVSPTHAEEGCIKYALQRSVEDPSLFVIVERWKSKEALDKHLASAHIAALFTKLPPLLAAPPEIQAFMSVPAGQPAKGNL